MTSKTHTARQSGPITLDLALTAGTIRVTAADVDRAEVTIHTPDAEGVSADAVEQTAIADHGDRLVAHVPQTNTRGSGTIIQSGRGMSIIQVAGTVYGNVSGVVIGNGNVIIGNGGAVMVGGSEITIEATVPVGSTLVAGGTSADVVTIGRLARVRAESVSGDMSIGEVASPDLKTTSGDITISALTGDGFAASVSGDIRVVAAVPCRLSARTVSGDVTVSGARVSLDARSVSGRVRQS